MSRELHIVERHGRYVVTTSDGRREVGASLPSAMRKAFRHHENMGALELAFLSIKAHRDPGQTHEGVQGT